MLSFNDKLIFLIIREKKYFIWRVYLKNVIEKNLLFAKEYMFTVGGFAVLTSFK